MFRNVIAYRSPKHRIFRFQRVEYRTLSQSNLNLEFRFAIDARKRTQVRRKYDAYHGSVCTSTESTAGKSCTIAFHLSPESADA